MQLTQTFMMVLKIKQNRNINGNIFEVSKYFISLLSWKNKSSKIKRWENNQNKNEYEKNGFLKQFVKE